ncbi:F-box only protein 42 isoform X1 [Trichogramma pretiosum]|uniref:F-box only protein 42 isoform X1 n=2 Tax=Trichogramma pretiosum TaxID=7493 RepID=UPI0006C95BDC|nr:F-box only protein 42 isoform X1 [Trichogramma pretiosum]
MQCQIHDLPDEVLEYILSLIPPYTYLQRCMFVCKRWYKATKNVIDHNNTHFQRSVAHGSLIWSSLPKKDCSSIISRRHSHSACTVGSAMYVFGGCTATCTTFNDLWKLDLDSRKWFRPMTTGNYPSPKACASMLNYKKFLILFGGWSHPSPYPFYQQWKLFNELHLYSLETNQWIAVNSNEMPPPVSAHSASIHGNLMIVFGGITNGHSTNDVWCLNLESYDWKKPITSTLKPQPRYGQSQIALGDKHLLILGGCTGPNAAINDVWLLVMEDPIWTWKKVQLSQSQASPTRIWCHQSCKVGNFIIVLNRSNQYHSVEMNLTSEKRTHSNYASSSSSKRPTVSHGNSKDWNITGHNSPISKPESRHLQLPPLDSIKIQPVIESKAFKKSIDNNSRRNRFEEIEIKLKSNENSLTIYVLDISKIICDCSASWVLSECEKSKGPDERILYSLVLGKEELIFFGGIKKEPSNFEGQAEVNNSQVYNDLYFINVPKYII